MESVERCNLQHLALRERQKDHFSVLVASGIFEKIQRAGNIRNVQDFGESLPIVMGSRGDQSLHLFIGLQCQNSPGDSRTKILPVGVKTDVFAPNMVLDFTEDDCQIVEGLFVDLEAFVAESAPDYIVDTGVFR